MWNAASSVARARTSHASRALLLLACVAHGCGDDERPDLPQVPPEPTADASRPELEPRVAELDLVSDSRVRLQLGQSATIAVQLRDEQARPLPENAVGFDLVGLSQDAGLSALEAMTDREGIARVTLYAGQRVSMFRVRVTAHGADPLFVDASIASAGFGNLVVSAPYSGERAVMQRQVLVRTAGNCEDAAIDDDTSRTVIAMGEDSAQLVALPSDLVYTVSAIALGKADKVLSTGCVERVRVENDRTLEVAIPFTDEPLQLAPRFALELSLSARAPATRLSTTIRRAAETLVWTTSSGAIDKRDGEGRFWLDTLDGALRALPLANEPALIALADAVQAARVAPAERGPDRALDGLLEIREVGPILGATEAAERARDALTELEVVAVLELSQLAKDLLSLEPERIAALPVIAGASIPQVTLEQGAEPIMGSLEPDNDLLMLESAALTPSFGALATEVLRGVLSASAYGEPIKNLAGCRVLEEWLREKSQIDSAACEDACIERVCDRAITRILSAAEAALAQIDFDRPRVTLSGDLTLIDEDGDLVVDRVSSAALSGVWEPSEPGRMGEMLSGLAEGASMDP